MFNWSLESIVFNGGQTANLKPHSIFVLIGPNSSGKSTALREIQSYITAQSYKGLVVTSCKFAEQGTCADALSWLDTNFSSYTTLENQYFFTKGHTANRKDIETTWRNPNRYNNFNRFLCDRLDTETRLFLTKPVPRTKYTGSGSSLEHYIHYLQKDDVLLKSISAEVRHAFNVDLLVNHGGGSEVWFNVGEEPERTVDDDRISSKYLQGLNLLPQLHAEGDGIRSFVGTLLAVFCTSHPLLLIDEPEAFLHPQQAQRLGSVIAKHTKNRQLVIATHSSDVIRGLLQEGTDVQICRLTRTGNTNNAKILSNTDLKKLWSNPLLSSPTTINGLFHKGVVVCEADADCRFYETLVTRLERGNLLSGPLEIYFIHGAGKGQLALLASSYKPLGVETAVIADIDLLRNEAEFKNVVQALSGNYETVMTDYKTVFLALSGLGPSTPITYLIKEAECAIANMKENSKLEPGDRKRLASMLEDTAEWSMVKRAGVGTLTGGDRQAADRLLKTCRAFGLFLVPKGVLERWWPQGSADKNQWIKDVIGLAIGDAGSLQEASLFMQEVCGYLGYLPSLPSITGGTRAP